MVSAQASLRELGIQLPQASVPFGAYVEAVQTGDLLFFTGGVGRQSGVEDMCCPALGLRKPYD